MNNMTVPPKGIWVILGLWLAGVFASSLISRSESTEIISLVSLGVALAWPVPYFLIWGNSRPVNRESPLRVMLLAGILIVSGVSVAVSPKVYLSAGYWVMSIVAFYILYSFSLRLDAESYAKGLKLFTVLIVPMLIGLAVYDYKPGERLGFYVGPLNPNAIALVAVSAAVAGIVFKSWVARLAVILGPVSIIYLTGSRASALAVLAAWAVIFIARLRNKGLVLNIATAFVILAAIATSVISIPGATKAVSDYFALDDPYRGIHSGATGRLKTWEEVWNLALDNPVTGVGLRAHEGLLKTNTSAHNGYLATLAEIGFLGFSCVIVFIISGIVNLLRPSVDEGWKDVQSTLLGLVVGYMIMAIFERYLMNFGNPTSLLFMLGIFFPVSVCRTAPQK
ncbi:MAG: hypothetical protein GC138_08515 [Gammaproteobacteria bacterium]|nr:hypothetical protein [Gammaproteobacteria bacterium]